MAVERIRIRRDNASTWTSVNPTLGLGEMALETDTQRMKIGDGATAWTSLQYLSLEPPGKVVEFAMVTAPAGYLACDGAAVSRTTYAALFSAIGTTWGVGDGSTTFNLPDLRGAITRGAGSHGSETMANGSAFAGPSVGSFENDQMQGHDHSLIYRSGSGSVPTIKKDGSSFSSFEDIMGQDPISDGDNGTPRAGDETRPFAAGVLKCIKT